MTFAKNTFPLPIAAIMFPFTTRPLVVKLVMFANSDVLSAEIKFPTATFPDANVPVMFAYVTVNVFALKFPTFPNIESTFENDATLEVILPVMFVVVIFDALTNTNVPFPTFAILEIMSERISIIFATLEKTFEAIISNVPTEALTFPKKSPICTLPEDVKEFAMNDEDIIDPVVGVVADNLP
ncbi:hypothetical protein PBCV1_a015L [Paramecium bursaria Chlorella virus 1]|uniref:Uncharacterized protein n=1 Tax=Paramecium bursaria Chlorella virus 1 TaxID=10506 RepID=Q89350_PBCV1|nr:hypothetical protein PBCV1_a015L [Paramecium bursaria Chlorella virus 1]AAC96383.1 hypothetical protein [Paramecium bursaria Chlorella virus 1]